MGLMDLVVKKCRYWVNGDRMEDKCLAVGDHHCKILEDSSCEYFEKHHLTREPRFCECGEPIGKGKQMCSDCRSKNRRKTWRQEYHQNKSATPTKVGNSGSVTQATVGS